MTELQPHDIEIKMRQDEIIFPFTIFRFHFNLTLCGECAGLQHNVANEWQINRIRNSRNI